MDTEELFSLITEAETLLQSVFITRGRDRMPPEDHETMNLSELNEVFGEAKSDLETFLSSYHNDPEAFIDTVNARILRGKALSAEGKLPSLRKLEITSPPTALNGMETSQRDFGLFIDWQLKAAEVTFPKGTPGFVKALDRLSRLTDEDIIKFREGGLTAEKALEWADFYKKAVFFTPSNPTAPGRAILMMTIADRLRALY